MIADHISRFERAMLAVRVSVCSALAIGVVPSSAMAQSDSDRATARALAEEGYNALKVQKYQIADDRFRRANALVHAPTLVVDDGRALMGLGRYVEAQERFELVLREGVADNAPAVWKAAVVEAGKLLEEVKPKIAWLTIVVPDVKHPHVIVDGRPISEAALGVKVAANPGTQNVEVGAAGYETKSQSVTLSEGGEQTLEVTLTALPAQPATPGTTQSARVASDTKDTGSPNRTPAYVALGVGGVGVVVGAVTGIIALQKRSDLSRTCNGSSCPRSEESTLNSYHSMGLVSGIGFGVGLAGAATGLVLLSFGGGQDDSKDASANSLRVQVVPGGLRFGGAF